MTEPARQESPPPESAGDERKHRLRGVMAIVLEGVIALSLALGCFLVFLWVLNMVFPFTAGLGKDVVFDRGQRRQTWGVERAPDRPKPVAAVLRVISNDVRTRKSEQIAWGPARQGGSVSEGDAVQTTRDGQATLQFTDGSALHLGRNSLLVVRAREEGSLQRATFQVPQGELWGSLPGEGEVHVNTPTAVVKIGTVAGAATKADFKVLVQPDRSSIVAVYRGSARVTTGSETQVLKANQFVSVDSSGAQSAPARLPDAPSLVGPADRSRFVYRNPPPKFAFQWTAVPQADEYRLVIARDQAFNAIVLDRKLSTNSLDFGRLPKGNYRWRVSTIRDRVEGRPSSSQALDIVRDGAPPPLAVDFPKGVVTADACTITGKSDADSRVFVAGQPATVKSDGSFSCRIPLKRGLNSVVVEALDPTGNTAYASTILEARY